MKKKVFLVCSWLFLFFHYLSAYFACLFVVVTVSFQNFRPGQILLMASWPPGLPACRRQAGKPSRLVVGNFYENSRKFAEKSWKHTGNPASQQAKPACPTRPGRPGHGNSSETFTEHGQAKETTKGGLRLAKGASRCLSLAKKNTLIC